MTLPAWLVCKQVVGDERSGYLRKFRSPRTEVLQRAALFKKLNDKCKRTKTCPHCGEANGAHTPTQPNSSNS